MLITRPRAATSAGSSAWITATCPNRFASNWRRHSASGISSTGAATAMPALLTTARSGRPAGSDRTRSATAAT